MDLFYKTLELCNNLEYAKRAYDFWSQNPEVKSLQLERDDDPQYGDYIAHIIDGIQFFDSESEATFLARYDLAGLPHDEFYELTDSVFSDVYGIPRARLHWAFPIEDSKNEPNKLVSIRPDPLVDPTANFRQALIEALGETETTPSSASLLAIAE